jgi:hypothetical protein
MSKKKPLREFEIVVVGVGGDIQVDLRYRKGTRPMDKETFYYQTDGEDLVLKESDSGVPPTDSQDGMIRLAIWEALKTWESLPTE